MFSHQVLTIHMAYGSTVDLILGAWKQYRDIEGLLAEGSISVNYETICPWWGKSSTIDTRQLKRRHQGFDDTFFINEDFVKKNSK